MQKLILTLIIITSPIFSHAAEVNEELHQHCIYPTVMIYDKNQAYGSGVIVKSEKFEDQYINTVITCYHVVDDMPRPLVTTLDYINWSIPFKEDNYPLYIYDYDPIYDIAICMFLSDDEQPTAEISFESLYSGNEIIGVGCGNREPPRVDYGRVTGLYRRFLRTSVTTINGDSGGPIFHDYKLVAIKQAIGDTEYNYQKIPIFNMSRSIRILTLLGWTGKSVQFVYSENKTPELDCLMAKVSLLAAPE